MAKELIGIVVDKNTSDEELTEIIKFFMDNENLELNENELPCLNHGNITEKWSNIKK